MTNPVAPKEGHYALLRNNEVTRPRPDQWANKAAFFDGLHHWWQDGTSVENCDAFDIIATISPADMQAAASGELERLRAALHDIFEMWAGSEEFIPHTAPEGYLLMLVKKMADRAASAKMEESK